MTPSLLLSLQTAPWAVMPPGHFLSRLFAPCAVRPQEAAESALRAFINGGLTPDGVGIVRVHGTIVEASPDEALWFGLVPPSAVRAVIDAHVAAGARAIYLDVDSPGGCVVGVPELADYIAALPAAGVQTIAGTSGLMASAAYWLASQCEAIVATRGAVIGSIGIYTIIKDTSKICEGLGVTVHLVATSDIKGTGEFGVPVTAKQLEAVREMVMETFALFRGDVKRARKHLSSEALTAQVWHAEGALARGLIDRVETLKPQPARKEA